MREKSRKVKPREGPSMMSDFDVGDDRLLNRAASDLELLNQYARQSSEDAFATLVHRHLGHAQYCSSSDKTATGSFDEYEKQHIIQMPR
jgi:hypothetical protein